MAKHIGSLVVAVALSGSTIATPACGQVAASANRATSNRHAVPEAQASAAEVTAARAMLARRRDIQGRPAVEPRFALDGHAPGWVSEQSVRRPVSRTTALAEALGGLVAESPEIGTCPGCVAVLLTLSDPLISADTAMVTATVTYRAGVIRRAYETVRFTLVRQDGSWHVHKSEQLGVT